MPKGKLKDIWGQYYIHKYNWEQLTVNEQFLNNKNPFAELSLQNTQYPIAVNSKTQGN